MRWKKGKLGAYAMECVAAGAHIPTHRLGEPAERPDDEVDCMPGLQFPRLAQAQGTRFFTAEWIQARYVGGQ